MARIWQCEQRRCAGLEREGGEGADLGVELPDKESKVAWGSSSGGACVDLPMSLPWIGVNHPMKCDGEGV
jgi:hypothetical protein